MRSPRPATTTPLRVPRGRVLREPPRRSSLKCARPLPVRPALPSRHAAHAVATCAARAVTKASASQSVTTRAVSSPASSPMCFKARLTHRAVLDHRGEPHPSAATRARQRVAPQTRFSKVAWSHVVNPICCTAATPADGERSSRSPLARSPCATTVPSCRGGGGVPRARGAHRDRDGHGPRSMRQRSTRRPPSPPKKVAEVLVPSGSSTRERRSPYPSLFSS
jgi:hypothetical protein